MTTAGFDGFPAAALDFLRELEDNNDRDWFKANRGRYDEYVVAPMRALGESLTDLGRPHMFRPWNDTRFRPGPPIKEHVGLAIGYEGAGGYYVELSLDGLLVAAGLHNPAPDQVDRLRRAVDGSRSASALTRALGRAEQADLGPWVHRSQAGTRIRDQLEAAAPLVRWLREHVGASQRGAARTG
jgi:uncharacterized protein (DUF2461 family)